MACKIKVGDILWLKSDGGNYIVSALTALAARGTRGLYIPDTGITAIRPPGNGSVTAVTQLVKYGD